MSDDAIRKRIHDAIRSGNADTVVALISADRTRIAMTSTFGTFLHVAAMTGQAAIARWLVEAGTEVNVPGGILGGTALNLAASHGHREVVEVLLELNASVDAETPAQNPLFSAIYGNHRDIVELLLRIGSDPRVDYETVQHGRITAVGFAEKLGRSEIAELLKEWMS